MSKSLYAQYCAEREGVSAIERDYGFATYLCNYHTRDLYICDFFIVNEQRRRNKSQKLLDLLVQEAKKDNLLTLSATCRAGSNGVDAAISGLIKYGFKCVLSDANGIYFQFKVVY